MLITKSFIVTKKNTNNYLCTKHLKICAQKQTPSWWRQLPICCACHRRSYECNDSYTFSHSTTACPDVLSSFAWLGDHSAYIRLINRFSNKGQQTYFVIEAKATALEMRQTKHVHTQACTIRHGKWSSNEVKSSRQPTIGFTPHGYSILIF